MLFARSFYSLFVFFLSVALISSCANIERVGHTKSDQNVNNKQSSTLPYRSGDKLERESVGSNELQRSLNPAVEALLKQAQMQSAEGNSNAAVSTIERALRISPKAPQLHLFLGELRLQQGQAHHALQLALKGQSLISSSETELAKSFWKLIGDAYTRLGSTSKASQAYKHL